MSFKISFKTPECRTVMEVRRQCVPESRSQHREAAVCTSQTGAGYSQADSGNGRTQYPAWRILADNGAHVDQCVIGVHAGFCEGGTLVCGRLAGGSASRCSASKCWSDMVTPVQTHHQVGGVALGQLQSSECSGRLAYQQRVTVVHPGHHQGQHGLDTGVPVQEASDVADCVQVMEHGALDPPDLAMHVYGGVHDDAEVEEGGHCMHADATNAHSQLQRSVVGLVVWSCDDHELPLIAVDLKLVGEQPNPDLLDTHLQSLQRMPVAIKVSWVKLGVQRAIIGIAVMVNSGVTPDDRTQRYDVYQEE